LLLDLIPELEQYSDWNDKINYLKRWLFLFMDIFVYEGIKQSNKILDLWS
jgi:hypothetical protein